MTNRPSIADRLVNVFAHRIADLRADLLLRNQPTAQVDLNEIIERLRQKSLKIQGESHAN